MRRKIKIDPLFADLYSRLLSEKKHLEAKILKFYILHKKSTLLYKKIDSFSSEVIIKENEVTELKKSSESKMERKTITKWVWHPNSADLVNDFLEESDIDDKYIANNTYLKENNISHFDFLNLSDAVLEEIINLRDDLKIGSLAQGNQVYVLNKSLFMDAFSKIRHDSTCSCISNEDILKKRIESEEVCIVQLNRNSKKEDLKKFIDHDWDKIIPNLKGTKPSKNRDTSDKSLFSKIKIHNKYIDLKKAAIKDLSFSPDTRIASWAEEERLPNIKSYEYENINLIRSQFNTEVKKVNGEYMK